MNQIVLFADREIAAHRPGQRRRRRWSHPACSHDRDRLIPFEHADDHGRAGDELDQPFKERLARVFRVVTLGQGAIDLDQLERRDPQALASKRPRIDPTKRRWTQSGLNMIRVRCMELKVVTGFVIGKKRPLV